jgi:glycosyltransferase involved in cell wall biosynthesis
VSTEQPRVSIVVPVYNTARFLRQCLDSLCAQTLRDIEIICVDDGSVDTSPDILASYAAIDERIMVISKKNSGYGDSMNRGLDEARGTYVGIVESDDFVSASMFERLLAVAQRYDADVVKSNYYEHEDGGTPGEAQDRVVRVFDELPYGRLFNPYDYQQVFQVRPCIWTGLYRRSLLEQCDIRFLVTPGASFQDTSFNFKVWASSERAVLLKDPLLHYRVDNESSSVKSGAKIYAVCDEYRSSEEFLARYPQTRRRYAKVLNTIRLKTYWWNYYRILPEYRGEFLERVSAEFRREALASNLVETFFSPQGWKTVNELIADPEAFAATCTEDGWF